jgi:hydrogenase maturation factor
MTMTRPDAAGEVTPDPSRVDLAGGLAVTALTMARRFAAGATMWCVSPPWPAHGRHVAVEFVHPVIVGKRALPAVSVDAVDVVGAVRLLARPGDILLAIGPAEHEETARLLRHAEAWGLARIWLGAGPLPSSGAAQHVVWLPDAEPAVVARSGDLVMLYHLLWELTHVVFEHPGLLTEPSECDDEVCITCSDQATVGEVAAVDPIGMADVVVAGRHEAVDVSLVDTVHAGDLVLVHAGVALSGLDDDASGSSQGASR